MGVIISLGCLNMFWGHVTILPNRLNLGGLFLPSFIFIPALHSSTELKESSLFLFQTFSY